MTFRNWLTAYAACTFALAVFAISAPALAKNAEPYNAADAARKYCGSSYKRYCKNVPTGGIESLNCLKEHVKRLPPACRKAVQAL
jgi:cysteine rich repeat protein